jgi:hypothetical protein
MTVKEPTVAGYYWIRLGSVPKDHSLIIVHWPSKAYIFRQPNVYEVLEVVGRVEEPEGER